MQSHCLVLPAPPQAELHRQEHSSTTNTPIGRGSLCGPKHSRFSGSSQEGSNPHGQNGGQESMNQQSLGMQVWKLVQISEGALS